MATTQKSEGSGELTGDPSPGSGASKPNENSSAPILSKGSGSHGNKANNGKNTKTLLYFAITVTALAAVLEFAKVFGKNTPLQQIMLGTASHTCVAVLMILAIFETWRQKHDVINKIKTKFGYSDKTSRNILYAIIFMVVLAMGMMAASEYHNQANSKEKGSDTSHALAGIVVAISVIAFVARLVMHRKRGITH